jgi:ferrous iron transport protein B
MTTLACRKPQLRQDHLFNQLTGTTAYVGNWPGVTVEKKEGLYHGCDPGFPGIYSLSLLSEEKIARRYILDEHRIDHRRH